MAAQTAIAAMKTTDRVSGGNARHAADWKGTAQFLGACAGDFGETIRGRLLPVGETRVGIGKIHDELWLVKL